MREARIHLNIPLLIESSNPPQQRLRSGFLNSEEMTRALTHFGYRTYPPFLDEIRETPADSMPRVKDAAKAFEDCVAKLVGREVVQKCGRQDEDYMKSQPAWVYAGWLTDEEWLLLRMKCF